MLVGEKLWLPLSNFIKYKTMDTPKMNENRFHSVHCFVLLVGVYVDNNLLVIISSYIPDQAILTANDLTVLQ